MDFSFNARMRDVRVSTRIPVAFLLVAMTGTLATLACASDAALLSLDAAVQQAEDHAPILDARRASLESAEHSVGPAGQLPDPTLVAGIDSLPVSSDEAFSFTRDARTTLRIGIAQQFPRRAKRQLRTERAQAGAAREKALLVNERLHVGESTARAWVARKTAEQRWALLTLMRSRAGAQSSAAQAALTGGRGSAADAIAAKGAEASLDDRISQAAQSVEEAKADLARWVADAGEVQLGDATDWSKLGIDPDLLLTHIGQHRELLAFDAEEQMANADVALSRAEKQPDWSVEVGYAQRGPRYSNLISLQVRVPLPLFAASRQDPLIAAKEATVVQIEAEREDARRVHAADLRKTLAAWRSAGERASRYEHELLPLANDRADAALAAYRGGRGDLQASLAALDNVIEQNIAYTEVLDALGQSWAVLHFAFPKEH